MFDGPVRQLGRHSVGARLEPESGREHRDGAEGLCALGCVAFLEVAYALDGGLDGSVGRKGSSVVTRSGKPVSIGDLLAERRG